MLVDYLEPLFHQQRVGRDLLDDPEIDQVREVNPDVEAYQDYFHRVLISEHLQGDRDNHKRPVQNHLFPYGILEIVVTDPNAKLLKFLIGFYDFLEEIYVFSLAESPAYPNGAHLHRCRCYLHYVRRQY